MTDPIDRLCAHIGVAPDYRGFEGRTVRVSPETRLAVLNAMGLEIASDADARERLQGFESEAARRPAPRDVITEAGRTAEIDVTSPVDWRLEAEGTGALLAEGAATDKIRLPATPMGVHRLITAAHSADFVTNVLARPPHAATLADRIGRRRIWGVTAPLYGMTDRGAAPLGDYGRLGDYAAAIASHGADFIGINPIHAMGRTRPDDVISPYSPSHRGFLNAWHLSGARVGPAHDADLIDYPAALAANAGFLATEFAAFRRRPDAALEVQDFAAFVKAAGRPLRDYALFEVLADQFGPDWRLWPAPYRTREPASLAAFEQTRADPLAMAKWAQWRADGELGAAQARATSAGMGLGLYLDLAVGPRLGGAETWAGGSSLITGATLGAPPDPLGPAGQSWGLAPLSPLRCREDGYAGFAALLRAVMRHAGMIRIDHALGLMRSFWIPEGGEEGAYVDYPFDALLAVVAIESARCGAVVIGEDLGLVPAGLRQKLAASGVYGLDVFQYMRTSDGGFVDGAEGRDLAIAAFATHDTPTIEGFFAAEDARLRHGFGGLDDAALARARADRDAARRTLGGARPVPEIHRRLARANAAMVAIQLDDMAESRDQQNLPGTIDQHPNWRRAAPFSAQDIRTSTAFAKLGADMRAAGRANPNKAETTHDLQDG